MLIRTSTILLCLAALAAGQDPYARVELTAAERSMAERALGGSLEVVLESIGSADPAVRREAGLSFQQLPRAAQARVTRAALWADEPGVAYGAAVIVQVEWLDSDEARRVRELLEPQLFAVDTPVDFAKFVDLLGAADVSRLLADPAPLPREHAQYVERLHSPMRPEHIPQLARLMLSDDALVREGARNAMRVVAERTDRYRENVASALLSWSRGVPMRPRFDPSRDIDPVEPREFEVPRASGGFPPLLVAVLRRVEVMQADSGQTQFEAWIRRWASAERAGAGDLELLRALARRAPVARRIAARAAADLGATDVLGALRGDDDPVVRALALCGLAIAADEAAVEELATSARTDSVCLGAWLEVAPDRALDEVAAQLLRADSDSAHAVVARVVAAMQSAGDAPFRIAVDPGVGLASRVRAAGPSILAVLAEQLPGARTRELAAGWLAELGGESLRSPAIDLLEVADRDGLVARLRELADGGDPAALDVLLALGDPASGASIVEHVRNIEAGRVAEFHATDVPLFVRLARSASPAVEAFLLDVLQTDAGGYRAFAALAALEALRGVDERLARSLVDDLYGSEDRVRDEWDRLAAAARDGPRGAVVLAWLASRPLDEGPLDGLGTLDAPAARAWLGRAVREREHGLFWWAAGELALAGDPGADAQVQRAIAAGWHHRIDAADPHVLTSGLDPRTARPWIDALGTNCCAAAAPTAALRAMAGNAFGDLWAALLRDELARPPTEHARSVFDAYGARLRMSRIAGHLVVGPDR